MRMTLAFKYIGRIAHDHMLHTVKGGPSTSDTRMLQGVLDALDVQSKHSAPDDESGGQSSVEPMSPTNVTNV